MRELQDNLGFRFLSIYFMLGMSFIAYWFEKKNLEPDI